MTEKLVTDYPDYAQRNFEYFLGREDSRGKRAEYASRGLIPTNNLSLWIVDNPSPFLVAGLDIPNPQDYRQKPFAHIFEALKTDHHELWQRAIETARINHDNVKQFTDLIFSTRDAETEKALALGAKCEVSYWAQAEVYTELFNILAPQMIAEGHNPLDVCM